nr:nucleotide exchange factor GrpE [uncultured Desulfobacter sp.]
MTNNIHKKIKAVLESSVSNSGFDLKNESSGQREPDGEKTDTSSFWKDKYLHLLADLENTKKRLARSSALEIEYQNIELFKEMLQVADGLNLILEHVSCEDDSRNIFQGIKGVKNIFDKLFIKYDVETIDALGAVFDPNLHEALGMVRNPEAIHHTVVRVEKKGYLYHGKLLRPAQVMVASG